MKKTIMAGMASFLLMAASDAVMPTDAIGSPLKPTKEQGKVMTLKDIKAGKNDITFISTTIGGDLKVAAHLYTPAGFDPSKKYPTIVYSGPFNQVKEQTGAVYAQQLADRGYVTIVFDHLGYGDSEGVIRNDENSFVKIETIRDAISFMGAQDYVDQDNLFGLGICASGGYMALVATTDKRLKAVASVAGMLGNQASYFGVMDRDTVTAVIAGQNAGRQKAYETGEIDYVDALQMDKAKDAEDLTVREGYDYYMTERAGAVTYPNYTHLSPSYMLEAPMLADAMSYAPYLYTPFIGITGSEAMTAPLTEMFYEKASEPKELVKIEGASHVSLYDIEKDVTRAVDAMDAFFKKHGGA